jgi:dTDP-4-dehydrorhamnose reductase
MTGGLKKVLVLGASGLLGNAVYRVLSDSQQFKTIGTIRSNYYKTFFSPRLAANLACVTDLLDCNELEQLIQYIKPDIVINCLSIGRPAPSNPEVILSILSVIPQRLALLCTKVKARLIQISSDGVFSGKRGDYSEDDLPDANDIYGIAKLLGEVNGENSVTLRTSIIGPELNGKLGMFEWLLSQSGQCKGYTQALFSGLTTIELAQLIRDVVIPRAEIQGVLHIASTPISKFDLLCLIAECYKLDVEIIPDESIIIDRSLSGVKFKKLTGYSSPSWTDMISLMYKFNFGLRSI